MFLKFSNDVISQHNVFPAVQSELAPLLSISVTAAGEFYCGKKYLTERIGLNSYLLLYTFGGRGKLCYRGKTFSAEAGSVLLIDCNEWQLYGTDGESWHFRFIHYTGTAARYLFESVTAGDRYVFPVHSSVSFCAAMNELFLLHTITLPQEFLLASDAVCAMFAVLLEERQTNGTRENFGAQILRAKKYIEDHFTQNISLDELAAQSFLSKYYFLRQFRLHTGFSPGAYLRACRINRAQNLLRATDLSVEEIASRSGYADVSAFIRSFRRSTGMTPANFRKL